MGGSVNSWTTTQGRFRIVSETVESLSTASDFVTKSFHTKLHVSVEHERNIAYLSRWLSLIFS